MSSDPSVSAYLISSSDAGVSAAFTRLAQADLDPGEVTVRVQYASVNYKDALAATGKGRIIRRFPCVGGIDASGVVVASDAPQFKPGDEVIVHGHGFGVSHHGGYATLARAPAAWVNRLPAGMSLLDAITLGVAGYTAALGIDAMELNGLHPSKGKVLVNGATGGVASVSIDLLAQRGYEVVAVTGKPAQAPYLRELGASEVIASADLPSGTRPLEPALWQGAVDSLGGAPLSMLTRSVRKDGVIAAIGNAAGLEFTTSVMPFILRGVRLLGINSDNDPPLREHVWQRLATDLRPRHLARIAHVVPFEQLPQAIDAVIGGQARGRTVIRIGG
ncbi:acryloyl-CoA reductase [Ramlibacter sp.]|uniref:acrylyl-CoA reductase family protein n=1 Tax=Ramlibacter sp. TaxID=1917967 RepID=UPI002C4C8C22|nr:acryloyl-CoA reductase [Ramlibacter sp.]HWI81831.1 acryloyl-CoA reductase [Ramlibacter sp.]